MSTPDVPMIRRCGPGLGWAQFLNVAASHLATYGSDMGKIEIRIDDKIAPLGIDGPPRITWTRDWSDSAPQRGYRVLVQEGSSTVADSTELAGSSNSWEFEGGDLASLRRYVVTVWILTTDGAASYETEFTTGVLNEKDWGPAKWITASARETDPAPVLRRSFSAPRGHGRVLLIIAVAGCAAISVNGVGLQDQLVGGITDFTKRVQYNVLDITSRVSSGENEVVVEVGKSFYGITSPNLWNWETAPWHAVPSIRAMIQIDSSPTNVHRLYSGADWDACLGRTVYNDLYGGETYDATRPLIWHPAAIVPGPSGKLENARQPPIRVLETLEYRSASRVGSQWVLDFGRVISGWANLSFESVPKQAIRLAYGEKLGADGLPNNDDDRGYFSGRFQEDVFIASQGGRQEWHPRFSWKGFRFIAVEGWSPLVPPRASEVSACRVHTAVDIDGQFYSSNMLLNRFHLLAVDTMLNNLHGIPTDTPKYEKNGWTGDGMVATEMFLFNFGASQLLTKWVDDIADTASESGIPKVIAPHGGWAFDWEPAPTWHAALVLIPWWVYRHTGDSRILFRHYDSISRYVRGEFERSEGGIATTTLGDWVSPETPPGGGNPPEDLRVAATAYLYAMCVTAAAIARIVGLENEARDFEILAATVQASFLQAFYDPELGIVISPLDSGFRQSHQVLAVGLSVLPEKAHRAALEALVRDIRDRNNHLNTGLLATKYLLPVLSANGFHEEALSLALQTTYPSWGYWVSEGATSFWEHWHLDSRSRNHYGLGTVDEWLFKFVLGIKSGTPGYKEVSLLIRPAGDITAARGHVRTAFGVLYVDWSLSPFELAVELRIPQGCTAQIDLDLSLVGGSLASLSARLGGGEHNLSAPR